MGNAEKGKSPEGAPSLFGAATRIPPPHALWRDYDPERLSDPAPAPGFSFVQTAAAMRTGNAAPGPNG